MIKKKKQIASIFTGNSDDKEKNFNSHDSINCQVCSWWHITIFCIEKILILLYEEVCRDDEK